MAVVKYLKLIETPLGKLMKEQVNDMCSIKIQLILVVEFLHCIDDNIIIKYTKTDPTTIIHGGKTREIINEACNTLIH